MVGKVCEAQTRPEVIIVGAGLGGLLLAILLEMIDVPYHVYERATAVKPLGSAMTLGPAILPVFEQIGLWEGLQKISLPCYSTDYYNDRLEKIGSIDTKGHDELLGYQTIIFARPKLYELMLSRVPAHKISHSKKVIRTEERQGRVWIHCSDGTSFSGDILVGADGAYSFVRQDLYKRFVEEQNQRPGGGYTLPSSDQEDLEVGFAVTAGVAEPEDPNDFPQLKDPFCHFSGVLEGSGYRAWSAVSVPGNQFCWSFGKQVSITDGKGTRKGSRNNNQGWDGQGSESIDDVIEEFKDKPCPWGGTMGDAIRSTPKDRISKVVLEEKVFKTWYGGQTVLIGDACHKMLTGAGLGAVNAMVDSVVLANCIYNMTEVTPSSITSVFQEYYRQRYHRMNYQFKRSQLMTSVMGGQNWFQRGTRYVLLNMLPKWIHDLGFVKSYEYRPQVAWLPLVPNRGTGRVLPQEGPRKVLEKYADNYGTKEER